MTSRRRFLQQSLFAAAATAVPAASSAVASTLSGGRAAPGDGARVVSTWDFGVGANQAAWPVLAAGGSALDAVEEMQGKVARPELALADGAGKLAGVLEMQSGVLGGHVSRRNGKSLPVLGGTGKRSDRDG